MEKQRRDKRPLPYQALKPLFIQLNAFFCRVIYLFPVFIIIASIE